MADEHDRELNAQALAASLWRNAGVLALAAAAASVATFFALSFVEPLYTADTGILIEERESPFTRSGSQPPSASEFDESAIQSQVEVLRSREIAEIVVDELGLGRNPEFDPAARPSRLSAFLVSIGLKQDPEAASVRQRAMETYAERLAVYPLGRSRVVGVDFTASAPELAANVANAVAGAYIRLQQEAKRESAVAATAWLEQEIERLRGRVSESEDRVAKYRANAGLFVVGAQSGGTLSTQQLGDINAELGRAKAARSEAEARAALVESLLQEDGALESSQDVLDSQLIQRLSERQIALRSEIADLSVALLPGHPRIRALQSQLTDLREQIRQEAQKVLRSLKTAARVAAGREASLIESLNDAKLTATRSNEQEIELRALEREAAAQRDLLETFLARYREAAARTDANYLPADARIISRAVPPANPSFPKKGMMSIAAGIAVLLAGVALLTMREFLTGRAYQPLAVSQRQAEQSELRMITSAPNWSDMDELDELETPLAPTGAELLDDLDDGHLGTGEIAEILASPAVRMVLFAGALGGEGAGEIALSSARLAAENDIRFVILDLGLLPSEALGGNEEPGLGDLLSGDDAFGEVIRRDECSRVHLIPMGTRTGEPAPERLALVLGALTHTYDKVIVVADSLDDWPYEHVRPDLCALVCGPETDDEMRADLYERALSKGAKAALIVRFSGSDGAGEPSKSEAA